MNVIFVGENIMYEPQQTEATCSANEDNVLTAA